ncbi:MAG: caspase family protein [Spirochaetaceae bacterium]|nr:caspase family protein [Spirochaetaceae bacterium]
MKRIIIIMFAFIYAISLIGCELSIKTKEGAMNLVVIALDYKNTNVSSLYGTLNDAKELEKAFRLNANKTNREFTSYQFYQEGFDNNKSIIENKNYPSVANILKACDDISINSQENDLTILYFSGHGMEEDGSILVGTTDYNEGKTLLDLNKINPDYLIKPIQIEEKLSKIKGNKLIIVDSCYSGFFYRDSGNTIDTTKLKKNIFETFFNKSKNIDQSIFVLCATEFDNYSHEPSYLLNSHPHGYFSAKLLEGLGWCYGEKGVITNKTVPSVIDQNDNIQGILSSGLPPASNNAKTLSVDNLYTYIKKHQNIPLVKIKEKRAHQHPKVNSGRKDLILFKY